LYVWQRKELRVNFADVWQGKELGMVWRCDVLRLQMRRMCSLGTVEKEGGVDRNATIMA